MPRYPEPRDRGASTPPARLPSFYSIESTRGFVAVADAEADIINFSAVVSRVEVSCETFNATLRFKHRDRDEADTVLVRAGTIRTFDFRCTGVRAFNTTGGSAASLQIIGYIETDGRGQSEPWPGEAR